MAQEVVIDYAPHSGGQIQFHESDARFRVLACGTRWGKDRCCVNDLIINLAQMCGEDRPASLIPKVHAWIVAPIFPLAKQIWREFNHFVPVGWTARKNDNDHLWEGAGPVDGAVVEVKSADKPSQLVSVGLDYLLVTEAARVKDDSWPFLRGRISSPGRHGRTVLNSTPRGKNWFFNMFELGQGEDPRYESWQLPSDTNPYFDPQEIEDSRLEGIPEVLIQQEYYARFLHETEGVFGDIDQFRGGEFKPPEDGMRYWLGVDLGQKEDYTVVTVLDKHGQLVHKDRFRRMPWPDIVDRVAKTSSRYPGKVLVDSTGIGSVTLDMLKQKVTWAEGFIFTQKSRTELINNLTAMLESGHVRFPEWKQLEKEMSEFEVSRTSSGKIRYDHPDNGYDDCIFSLALASWDFIARSPVEEEEPTQVDGIRGAYGRMNKSDIVVPDHAVKRLVKPDRTKKTRGLFRRQAF